MGRPVHTGKGDGGVRTRCVLRAAAVRLRARRLRVLGAALLLGARRGVARWTPSHPARFHPDARRAPSGLGRRSVLARVDFRLTNLRSQIGPQRFDGYTVFSTPTPYIAMPDSTVARWITGVAGGPYGEVKRSTGMEAQVIRGVTYRGRTPPVQQ